MRARRQKLTALQLLSRNVSEAIVDKDNHARDVCKYIIMSHPEPAGKTPQQLAAEAVRPLAEAGDLTSASIRYQQLTCVPRTRPIRLGRYRERRY
jgi:hypothetical protein